MKRKYIKKLVSIDELADFFGMEKVDIGKHFAKGYRLDYVYIVFNRDDLTNGEKREYLYKTSMSLQMKNNIFERYIGDYGFIYNASDSNSLEVRF